MNCGQCGIFLPKVSNQTNKTFKQSGSRSLRVSGSEYSLGSLSTSNCLRSIYNMCMNQEHPGPTPALYRSEIVEWILESCERLGFCPDIGFHAVVLFDQLHLQETTLRMCDYELIACTCLFIAAKNGITDVKMKQSSEFASLISYHNKQALFGTNKPTLTQRQQKLH